MDERVALLLVDAVEVAIVVDHRTAALPSSTEIVRRPAEVQNGVARQSLRTEHGYALLLTVVRRGWRASLLYDGGRGEDTVKQNLDVLGVQPGDVQAVVLSHGHPNHHGGLEAVLRWAGRQEMPLVLHPDAWRERRVVSPTEDEVHLPPPSYGDLARAGATIVEERGPTLLLDGTVLATGQIERVTPFERGMPSHQALTAQGTWEPDPWIWDDQALVCHLKGKGLVVLSACCHAGAINTIRYAHRLTGAEPLYALVGGLHLSRVDLETVIAPTLEELGAMTPAVLVPGHCTGEQATDHVARRFPAAYIPSGAGTRVYLT
jgi:7,8-dihydropterin-6-yl-methyl-4-(beta-D-ribofuranosyl)aminobenzene 5'-phosphate synthase